MDSYKMGHNSHDEKEILNWFKNCGADDFL